MADKKDTTSGSALAPTAPGTDLAPATSGAVARRPAGGNVPASLAGHSYLDEIRQEMALLNGELQALNDGLHVLKTSSTALDANIANVDELSNLFEAPATTRSALDADSSVAALIDEMTTTAQGHGHSAQVLNATAFLGLKTVTQVQDNQRSMGAGPRLLASAGRL